ncbi:DUF1127 domain-containing protein [Mesorhizobium ciceri]|uniref:YjiS-like domain-containing protein n=1 Tax=Mesorhizobium ciceri biovar biserrulae (strain HAMBI 2942 / LMG 23838 / WSM1271) TaxID=765698 RepID=E8TFS4_MESCW|nr:DUF1127 domain-containing protein [Mesorhizobium ciceri]ADV09954.1 hypothetical protein Mesci_0785 [Mesorhizobium ciceri biovar biserrulae WSM1271]
MAARTAFPSTPLHSRRFFPFVSWLRSRLLARWYGRHLQRLDLAEIDDHQLRDLGLTRQEVRRECAKSFWQP